MTGSWQEKASPSWEALSRVGFQVAPDDYGEYTGGTNTLGIKPVLP